MNGTVIDCDKQNRQDAERQILDKFSSKGGITCEFVFECSGWGAPETRKEIRIGEQKMLNELESKCNYAATRKEDAGAIRKKGTSKMET